MPDDGGITVYGSMQCPYYVHRALMVLLGLPGDKVRVVQTETGGGFGGKEEYPSMIAGHAALLARKSGRPVKLIYDRVEDMVATTKRHPAIIRHRTGVTRDGRLTAIEIDAVFDGGAYATLSAVVLSRGVIHASGPYRCDHVRIRGRAMHDQHAAQRRVPRLRRAADAVRRRSPHGPHRRGAAAGSGPRCARSTRCGRATRPPPVSGWARTAARCRCCARRSSGPISRSARAPRR